MIPHHNHPEEEKSDTDSTKKVVPDVNTRPASITDSRHDPYLEEGEGLKKAFKFASYSSVGLFVVLMLAIPLPLFFSQHIYTPAGFTGWVAVGITWIFFSIFAVVLYPVYESRVAVSLIFKGIMKVRLNFQWTTGVFILTRRCRISSALVVANMSRLQKRRPPDDLWIGAVFS